VNCVPDSVVREHGPKHVRPRGEDDLVAGEGAGAGQNGNVGKLVVVQSQSKTSRLVSNLTGLVIIWNQLKKAPRPFRREKGVLPQPLSSPKLECVLNVRFKCRS
jgi:hypothetical protein